VGAAAGGRRRSALLPHVLVVAAQAVVEAVAVAEAVAEVVGVMQVPLEGVGEERWLCLLWLYAPH